MATSKKDQFLGPEVRLADYSKALAHPARIAILKVLAERGSCICGEVVDELPLAQATVSQHLRALKDAGLIEGSVDGPRSRYRIDARGLRAFMRSTQFLFSQLEQSVASPDRPSARA